MKEYAWESQLAKSYDADHTCEYGYPTQCGEPADFVFDPFRPPAERDGHTVPYPTPLYSCRKHVFEMKTGVEPRKIVRSAT